MKWTDIPTGRTHGAFQHLMVALGDNADTVVDKLNADEAYTNRLAILCHNNGFEPSVSQVRAREIMGANFFGIEEAIKHFGVNPSKRQLAYMAEVPFSEAVLSACKDSHVLVAYFRNPLLDVRAKTAQVKLPNNGSLFCKQNWYDREDFANGKGQLDWYLIRKTPVPDSTSKTWSQQQELLNKEIEETPEARVMVYTIIGHFLNTEEHLFEKVWVCCSDLDSDADGVGVRFGADGLGVGSDSGDDVRGDLGLASSRKSES